MRGTLLSITVIPIFTHSTKEVNSMNWQTIQIFNQAVYIWGFISNFKHLILMISKMTPKLWEIDVDNYNEGHPIPTTCTFSPNYPKISVTSYP